MNRYLIYKKRKKVEFLEGGFFKGQRLRKIDKNKTNGFKAFDQEIELVSYESSAPAFFVGGEMDRARWPRFKVKDLSKRFFNKTYIHASYILEDGWYEQI